MKSFMQAASFLIADFASTIFFLAVLAVWHNVVLAIVLGMVLGAAQIAWQILRGQPVGVIQWLSFFLVVSFGTLSLVTHDARFVMVKPSLIYVIVGIVMLKPGWMNRYVPPIVQDNAADVAFGFGFAWAALMFGSSAVNGVAAMKLPAERWAEFMSIWAIASKLVLFLVQYATLRIVVTRRLHARARTAAAGSAI